MFKFLSCNILLVVSVLFSITFSEIVYTDVGGMYLTPNDGMVADIDFNGDNISDFTFADMNGLGSFFDPDEKNIVTLSTDSWDVIKPLLKDDVVDSSSGFFAQGDAYINPMWYSDAFITDEDRYIGVKFKIEGKVHYGWIRVFLTYVDINELGMITYNTVFYDFAYETEPNKRILCGDDGTVENNFFNIIKRNNAINVYSISANRMKLSVPETAQYEINFYSINGQLLKTMKPILTAGLRTVAISDGISNSKKTVIVQIKNANKISTVKYLTK